MEALSPAVQEWIALTVVTLTAFRVLWRVFGSGLLNALASHLLRRGKVKWAMRLRRV